MVSGLTRLSQKSRLQESLKRTNPHQQVGIIEARPLRYPMVILGVGVGMFRGSECLAVNDRFKIPNKDNSIWLLGTFGAA